jgi:hypothetical protein
MPSSILISWEQGQSKSRFYSPAILTLCVNPQRRRRRTQKKKKEDFKEEGMWVDA